MAAFKHKWFYNVKPASNGKKWAIEVWTTYELCLKLARKTPEQPFYCWLWKYFALVLKDWNDGTGPTYVNPSD